MKKQFIKIKLDPEVLAELLTEKLGREITKDYVKGILTPKGKLCKDEIKGAICDLVDDEILMNFDLDTQIHKILVKL